MLIVGSFFLLFGLLVLSAAITGNIRNADGSPVTISDQLYSLLIGIIVFILPAILLMLPYILNRRLLKLRERYLALIEVHGITDVNELSQKLNKPVNVVSKQIQKLKDKNMIVFRPGVTEPEEKYVRCENCTADSLVRIGLPAKCDYCGSPLSTDD